MRLLHLYTYQDGAMMPSRLRRVLAVAGINASPSANLLNVPMELKMLLLGRADPSFRGGPERQSGQVTCTVRHSIVHLLSSVLFHVWSLWMLHSAQTIQKVAHPSASLTVNHYTIVSIVECYRGSDYFAISLRC